MKDTYRHLSVMNSAFTIDQVRGDALQAIIGELARLRIAVFREYPYLYDGTMDYEESYLRTYSQSPDAIAVLVRDSLSGGLVGASTGLPLAHETQEFLQPFAEHGLDVERIFYCGESVLLPVWRGRGIYSHFWQGREAHARALGKKQCCFCAVVRPVDHPLRPAGYQPLDNIWRSFGYRPQPGLVATYPWKDIDQPESSEHLMQFWLKTL